MRDVIRMLFLYFSLFFLTIDVFHMFLVFSWSFHMFHVLRMFFDMVAGLEHFVLSHILGMSSSQLTNSYFRGVGQPPTRYYPLLITINHY